MDIEPGTKVVISNDIIINDAVAFSRGEEVVVETVAPNAQKPEYRYVVTSARLGSKYQLRDADIVLPIPSVQEQPESQSTQSRLASFGWWKIAVIGVGVLVVAGLVVGLIIGLGGTKKVEKKTTTTVETTAKKEIQVTNVQVFPASSNSLTKAVVFKVTNPNTDYYSHNTYVKVNLYDSQGSIVGTQDGCIWSVFPGSRWCCYTLVTCVGEPVKVETQPRTGTWQKIDSANIPRFTITQSAPSGSQIVGSFRYEGSFNPQAIAIIGVVLDASGSVINYGFGQVNNPIVGDNPFNFSYLGQGGTAGQTEFSFELLI